MTKKSWRGETTAGWSTLSEWWPSLHSKRGNGCKSSANGDASDCATAGHWVQTIKYCATIGRGFAAITMTFQRAKVITHWEYFNLLWSLLFNSSLSSLNFKLLSRPISDLVVFNLDIYHIALRFLYKKKGTNTDYNRKKDEGNLLAL